MISKPFHDKTEYIFSSPDWCRSTYAFAQPNPLVKAKTWLQA